MATVKSNPAPEGTATPVEAEAEPVIFTDQRLLKMLQSPKSVVLVLLAEKKKAYETAKAAADKEKNEHDAIVSTLKMLRADLSDLEKLEKRGRPAKDEAPTETPAEGTEKK